ncbi:MAG: NepR family anti-sigma factor [Pseudomonadota bacterium]
MGRDHKVGAPPTEDEKFDDDPLMGQLKTIYDDVAQQPLPTELISLLEKLDAAERNR